MVAPPASPPPGSATPGHPVRRAAGCLLRRSELAAAAWAGATLLAGFILARLAEGGWASVGTALLWLSLALGSIHGLPAAWRSVQALRPDIDLLMVVGAYLSALIGHPEEGALLLFLFTLASGLEHRAMAKAREAVARLNRLMPNAARRRSGDQWEDVDPSALQPGDLIMVRPGELVPADATVLHGSSHLDQSSLTGESLPRSVAPEDSIFAGTLNQDGALEARVVRPVSQSSIHRILQLVLEAQERRQPMQRLIDRLSTPYSATVMILAVAAAPALVLLTDLSWASAAYRSITLLVVCSPCALVIATPTATLCGLSRAARAGVLIKGGDALERLSRVRTIAMDKTGTLTTGRIEVASVEPVGGADVGALLGLAMAAEERSTHPIAAAIVKAARQHGVRPAALSEVVNVPGRGIEARHGGARLRIGTLPFCQDQLASQLQEDVRARMDRIRASGGMPTIVACDGAALVLGLSDRPRQGAESLVGDLRALGVDRLVMLTGDHRTTAERVASQLGIAEFHAELLPERKVEHLERLRSETDHGRGGGLAVVGDGVNDAPALAAADIGLAMGAIGSDAAMETADVVLLNDDLARVPWVIGLAQRVRRVMLANLLFALAVIATLATCTLLGLVALGLGVLGHEGSTLLVVGNSLRLLAHPDGPIQRPRRKPRPAAQRPAATEQARSSPQTGDLRSAHPITAADDACAPPP